MKLDELNLDFDIDKLIGDIKDIVFKIVRIIFTMISNLPTWVKIVLSVFFVLFVIGIAILTWRYRYEWKHVKY